MARLPRLTLPGHGHYVRQESVHGQALAADAQDVAHLLGSMRELSAAYEVAVWAYAILPDALECVLCPATDAGLGRFMQALGRRYVQSFNRRHGRHGALWAGRFRAALVEDGEWMLTSMIRTELQARAHGSPSSEAHHAGQIRDPLLAEPAAYWALGNTPFERELAWRQRLADGIDPAVESVLARAVHGAWVVGSPAFAESVAAASGRPARPRPAGRPRRPMETE